MICRLLSAIGHRAFICLSGSLTQEAAIYATEAPFSFPKHVYSVAMQRIEATEMREHAGKADAASLLEHDRPDSPMTVPPMGVSDFTH